ncbi:hypothetical protein ACWDYH_15150 [Nocardia goodfellowii]|uniref:Membrane protein n=1 Tax=Nocardia goodfellowii TaxID=882446 RepID=A0ABS4QQK6_9NOCA|nr:hypothetical protein [Nocardia goodfellowii]MBP2193980.1 putative membrane protein [Nocardia goodfellowii]
MQTLIVVGVVVIVLVLVFAVVQFASRPPKVRSYWDSKEPATGRDWVDDD